MLSAHLSKTNSLLANEYGYAAPSLLVVVAVIVAVAVAVLVSLFSTMLVYQHLGLLHPHVHPLAHPVLKADANSAVSCVVVVVVVVDVDGNQEKAFQDLHLILRKH